MKPSFVFLCLSLATLSLAAIPSAEEGNHRLSRKRHLESSQSSGKKVKRSGDTSSATGQSSQATKKKPVKGGKKMPKKRSRVDAAKGVTSASADEMPPAVRGSGKDSQGNTVLSFPKVLVELIGAYLDGSYSVVFERSWSANGWWSCVAVDSEGHYLITEQDIQASSHGDGEQVSLGSPDLSDYDDFHSSHDGRFLFFTCKTKEQVSSNSSEKATRWLVQETGTKSLKSVTFESDKTSFASSYFMLSASGKTLLSTSWITSTTSVYQIKEHGKAALASKKANINGHARAVSGNDNRILLECKERQQLGIHDISGDESHLVLEINYAGTGIITTHALSNDGSKAAFIENGCKVYIVDVSKQKGSVSVSQLTPIGIPNPNLSYRLIYDAKDRLYVCGNGNLWLVDPSESKLVSLEEAEMPQGYETMSSAISSDVDYTALLLQSKDKNKKGKYQFQMIVKRKDTKDALMRLCGCES